MGAVPAEHDFPSHPSAWYLFGTSAEVRKRPVSKKRIGRRLVAFRTSSGTVAIMDAACSHMAADLGRGAVVNDCLQCPFHHWEYDAGGLCRRIPAQQEIPAFARQRAYPAVERHGLIFFWNGVSPRFPLPFFIGVQPNDFVRGRPFQFVADCSWMMLVANGFDHQHFLAVHDRRLLAPPEVDSPEPCSRRARYRAEIVGSSIFDRLLKQFVGRTVEISITNYGGTLVLVTGQFRRTTSYIMIAAQPLAAHETLVEVIVFAERGKNPASRWLGERLGLEVRRLFTQGFLHDDFTRLSGIRYNPWALVESDRIMTGFFQWLADLPRDDYGHTG